MDLDFLSVVKNVPLDYKLKQLDETIQHKIQVLKAGQKLIQKLFQYEEDKDAVLLLQRIMNHDNTKATCIEFGFLAKSADENGSLKSPQAGIDVSRSKMKAIREHWHGNDHHPEFWLTSPPESLYPKEPSKISIPDKLVIMEMCCDWYARATQYNTDVKEYWHKYSKKRWAFDITTTTLIDKYIDLLLEEQ